MAAIENAISSVNAFNVGSDTFAELNATFTALTISSAIRDCL